MELNRTQTQRKTQSQKKITKELQKIGIILKDNQVNENKKIPQLNKKSHKVKHILKMPLSRKLKRFKIF